MRWLARGGSLVGLYLRDSWGKGFAHVAAESNEVSCKGLYETHGLIPSFCRSGIHVSQCLRSLHSFSRARSYIQADLTFLSSVLVKRLNLPSLKHTKVHRPLLCLPRSWCCALACCPLFLCPRPPKPKLNPKMSSAEHLMPPCSYQSSLCAVSCRVMESVRCYADPRRCEKQVKRLFSVNGSRDRSAATWTEAQQAVMRSRS